MSSEPLGRPTRCIIPGPACSPGFAQVAGTARQNVPHLCGVLTERCHSKCREHIKQWSSFNTCIASIARLLVTRWQIFEAGQIVEARMHRQVSGHIAAVTFMKCRPPLTVYKRARHLDLQCCVIAVAMHAICDTACRLRSPAARLLSSRRMDAYTAS